MALIDGREGNEGGAIERRQEEIELMIWREEGIQASSRGRQSSLDLQLTHGVAGEGLVVQMAIPTVTTSHRCRDSMRKKRE